MLNGQDINLKLMLRNKDRTNKAMSLCINAQAMMYDGKPANNIQSIVQEKTLLPGQGQHHRLLYRSSARYQPPTDPHVT